MSAHELYNGWAFGLYMFTLAVTLGERALLNNKIKKYDILASALFFPPSSLSFHWPLSSLSFYLSVSRRVRGLLQAAAGLADSEECENNLGSALFHHLLLSEVCF